MQQAVDEDGVIWNVDAQGNAVGAPVGRVDQPQAPQQTGPAPFTVGTPRAPEPKAPYRFESNDGSIWEVGPDGQPRQLFQDSPVPKAGDANGAKQGQRAANLRALEQNIARVRELYQKNLKGGWANQWTALVPDILNPTLGQFDSAGAGLSETGLAAFRVPGVGSQSDAELRAFVDANRPSSTDSDLKIEEKLRNLETRLNATMQEMGVQPPAQQGPTVLRQAAGVQQSQAAPVDGVTSQGGLQPIPELAGMENTVIDMIGRGANTEQVLGFLSEQLSPYDARPDAETADWIQGVIDRHQADPSKPVRSLGSGWELLRHRKVPEGEQSVLGGFADTSLGTALMTGANAATGGLPAYLAGKQDVMGAAAQERPGEAMAGEIGGGALGMLGINRAAGALGKAGALLTRGGGIGGDMAYGATRGGLEGGPGGAVAGALAAGVGNKVGSGIVSGTGAAVRGVSSPAVRYLADKGVPMTLGQMMGNRGIGGRMMNKLESVPILGDALQQRRMEGVKAFNEEAFRQAVNPIDGPAPGFGPDGIEAAQQQVGQAYDNAYGGISLTPDEQFAQQAGPAIQQGRSVPVMGEQFDYIMQNKIAPLGAGDAIDGPRLQAALQALKGARSSFVKEGAMGNEAANAVTGVESALNDMVARQAPGALPAIGAANAANRNVSTLGNAVMGNADGLFTPAQLRRAGIGNTKKFGGQNKAARGDIPFKELIGYGQDVLPSTIPNSGSADRGMASMLLPVALGGGAVGAQQFGEPTVAIPLAALTALTSKQGSKIAQKAMTGRSDAMRAAGIAIRKQKRKAGIFGASAASSMVPQFPQ